MLNYILFFILYLYSNCIHSILNNQFQEQSIYQIQNQDKIIQIWIRFQTQFIDLNDTQGEFPFSVVRDHNSLNLITLSFQLIQDNIVIKLNEKNQENKFLIPNNISEWNSIELIKSQQLEEVIIFDKKISLAKLQNYVQTSFFGFIFTWQNKTFSLKAYNQKTNNLVDIFMMKNNIFVNTFRQIVMNRRDYIYIQFYFRQNQLDINKCFLILIDEIQTLKFILQNNTLNLIDERNLLKSEIDDLGTQWNFISIQLVNYDTIFKVTNNKAIFHNVSQLNYDMNLLFGLQLVFLNNLIQVQNLLIMSDYQTIPTFECHPYCKECNATNCLKCLNNLSIDNDCQCSNLQYFDQGREICIDVIDNQQIELDIDDVLNCQFGYYYNQDLRKCLHWQQFYQISPQLQQFECQECLFNTDIWTKNRTCIYLEIYTLLFMEDYFQYQLFDKKQIEKIQFNFNYSTIISNQSLEFDQMSGQIIQKQKDLFQTLEFICEQGYYLVSTLQKCLKIQIGALSQSIQLTICKLGFTQIHKKCPKCSQNCQICQFLNKQMDCLIPTKGYYLHQKQIQKCPKDCPFCFNNSICKKDLSEITQINKNQHQRKMNNCILQYKEFCLICRQSYFLDVYNNCIHKQSMVDLLEFQLIIKVHQQRLDNQQILNFILSNKVKYSQQLFQIQIYSTDFQILQSDKQDIEGCEKTQQFNSISRCTKVQNNFQYLSSLSNVYQCPNNHCTYNLILNVTVYISNRQLILLDNNTYYNFLELFNSIKRQLIYLKYIKINAAVYVFESIGQDCQDYGLFYLNYTEIQHYLAQTEIKLVLNFRNQAIFPECYKELIINFDYTEINYLSTTNKLKIVIDSDYVKFYKCKLREQTQQVIIISNTILFFNTTFMNKELQIPLIILQSYDNLKEIQFINCNFGDILLDNTNLIELKSDTQFLLFQNTQMVHLYFNLSSFIAIRLSVLDFQIKNMNISQLDIRNSHFFVLPLNKGKAEKSLFQLINIDNSAIISSTFIFSEIQITIQLFKIRSVELFYGKFLDLLEDCKITNILFDQINSSYSYFIEIQNNQAEFSSIYVQQSVLDYGTQLLISISQKIQIKLFKILGCDYKYNLNLISTFANQIKLNQIDVVILNVYGQIYSIIYQYLIFIKGQSIYITNMTLSSIELSQQKLMQITYKLLQFEQCKISRIRMKQDSEVLSDLVSFIQYNKNSQSFLGSFKIQDISITWKYQSVFFQFQGKQGPTFCYNFSFIDMESYSEFFLFSSSTQYIKFDNMSFFNVDQLGFLLQNNSYADIIKLNYYSKSRFGKLAAKSSPIFTNFASQYEVCKLQINNSIIGNLKQPLVMIQTNGILQMILFNVTIMDYQSQDNLITLIQNSEQTEINLLFIEYLKIKNISSPKYLIKTVNTQAYINNLFITNSNIGLILGIDSEGIIIDDIRIFNSSHQNQNYISFYDVRQLILNQILAKSIMIYNFTFIMNNDKKNNNAIIQDFHVQQAQSENFFIINISKQDQVIVRQFELFQSEVKNSLAQITLEIEQSISYHIQNIYVQNSKIKKLFEAFTNSSNIQIDQLYLFNNEFLSNQTNNMISFENSFAFNCSFQDYSVQIFNKRLEFWNNMINQNSPLFLSFHQKRRFLQVQINQNVQQVQFNNNSIIYLPTGIPIDQYTKIDFITQQQERIYDYFAIFSNYPEDLQCTLQSSIDNQIGNYTNLNQFQILNQVNVIDNFTFYYNPYQNYSYIQNDIACDKLEFILRFNVRILPCQLGEYFNQNQCKVCDVDRLQYSVNRIAYFCNIININKIEKAKRGQIKLRQGYWRPQIDNNFIEYCNSELCLGGWQVGDHSCTQGQLGALCKECDIYNTRGQGQYAQNESGCLLCDYGFQLLFKGFLIISWLMFLVYLSYDTDKQVILQYLQFKISQRKLADILMRQSLNQISVIIKICTNYSFYLYLIKNKLDFLFYQVNVSVSLLSNPIQLISPQLDCLLVKLSVLHLPYINLIYSLLTPFYILSLFYFFYMVMMYLKWSQFQFNIIMITIYSVYLYNQQLIISSQIKLLSSVKISGINYIYFNTQYKFNTKQHYDMIFYLILPTTILFLLIPIIIYFQLKNKDKRSIAVIKYYGILFREYKQETYYWEIIRIYVKILTIVLLYLFNQENQAFFIFLVQFYLIILTYCAPYPLKNLNSLEQRSLIKLTWSLIVIFFMQNNSKQLRGTLFTLFNFALFIDIITNLQQKIKLQFKESLLKVKRQLLQKIPQSSRYIIINKSNWTQQNIQKIKGIKSNTNSLKSIQFKEDVPFSTYNVKSEIELVTFKQQDIR